MRALIRKALVWYIRATGPSPAVLFDTMRGKFDTSGMKLEHGFVDPTAEVEH